jgi:hypothetical protein
LPHAEVDVEPPVPVDEPAAVDAPEPPMAPPAAVDEPEAVVDPEPPRAPPAAVDEPEDVELPEPPVATESAPPDGVPLDAPEAVEAPPVPSLERASLAEQPISTTKTRSARAAPERAFPRKAKGDSFMFTMD